MKNYFTMNLAALNQKYPGLSNDPRLIFSEAPAGFLQPTETPFPTLRLKESTGADLFLYDPRNPLEDVKPHLTMIEGDGEGQSCIFIGMGLGYGPLSVLREKSRIGQILICEPCPEIYRMAMMASDLRPLILSEKTALFIGEPNWDQFRSRLSFSAGDRIHFMNLSPLFHWKQDRYVPVNQKAYEIANEVSIISSTTAQNNRTLFCNLFDNLTLLSHAYPASRLKGAFKNKPALLVSAGPSLTDSIPDIRQAVGKCVIVAADAALKPLMDEGISPDFVTTLDFRDVNFEKLAPFIHHDRAAYSILYEIGACPKIPKRVPSRHLFYAFQKTKSQEWIRKALNVTLPFPDCLTVAHLSLGFALLVEASPIIFVGQDLAYTSSTSTHAKGSVFSSGGAFSQDLIVSVTGINGERLKTHRGFLAFKTGFETIIRSHPGTYINSSLRGAHIEGTEVIPLKEVISNHMTEKVPLEEIIACVTKEKPGGPDVTGLIRECKGVLNEIGAKTEWVKQTYDQIQTIQMKMKEKQTVLAGVQSPDHLPPEINAEIITLNELKKQSERGAYISDLFYPSALEIDRRVSQNRRIMSENYIEGVKDMLDIMLFENKSHLNLLDEYGKRLSALSGYLEQEKRQEGDTSAGSRLPDLISLYCQFGNYRIVDLLYQEALTSDTMTLTPQSYFFLGVSKCERFQFDEAERLFQEAIHRLPSLRETVIEYRDRSGEALIQQIKTRFGPVDEWLKRFREITRGREWAKERIRQLWEQDAIQIRKNIQNAPFDTAKILVNWWRDYQDCFPEWHFLKAMMEDRGGNRDEALTHLTHAVSRMPDNDAWQALLAGWLLEKGAFDEGIRHVKAAVRLNPHHALLWEEIGDALVDGADYESALIAYENWFLALPKTPEALKKMGDCYLNMGEPHAAIKAYETVLNMKGADPTVIANLKKAKEMVK